MGEVSIGGATARFIHLKSRDDAGDNGIQPPRRPIVFLHGNPSWSYVWRSFVIQILPFMAGLGYDVYALDWLGHGRSDKIIRPELITFELHMRTLIRFF
jgi:pimeloyl-ACP methyl ester carboxylesterase